MERIVIAFNEDGTFRGSSSQDFNKTPTPLDTAQLDALSTQINSAALADNDTLKAERDAANAARDTAEAEVASLQEQVASLQEQVDTAPVADITE